MTVSRPAAIMGVFADVQSIRTRSTCVLKIEVPIERMDEVLAALGGWPQPGSERQVAVALLTPQASAKVVTIKSLDAKERYIAKDDMAKAVTRAALLCRDEAFQYFIGGDNDDQARVALCARIGILSRSAIGTEPEAYRRFVAIEDQYRAKQHVDGYGDTPWTAA